jgi:hypothetical protein
MRLYEFIQLNEYKRDITIQKLGDKLINAAKRDRNQTIDEIFDSLESIDPTKNKQYVQWLANQYIKGQFRLEDSNRVKQVLVDFDKLKPRLQQRDINRYDFHSLDDTIDNIKNVELGSGATDNIFEIPKDSEVLYSGPYGILAIPKTEEASCELGKGTKWCTAAKENNMFNTYSKDGPLYIWRDRNGAKYQFHFNSMQFMDSKDIPIEPKLLNYFRTEHPILSKLFKREEKEISQNAKTAYYYAVDVIGGRFPGAESIIAKDPEYSYLYAKRVVKDRWPEAESTIIKNAGDAYYYSKDVIKGRWPEAESTIIKDPNYAYLYARDVIKGRWPEAESTIIKDPNYAYLYARDVIQGRWPEAEPIIVKDYEYAYLYAKDVIKGRWPVAESTIIKNSSYAYYYAYDVIKDRWPEAEPIIAKKPASAWQYARDVIRGRWPEAEPAISTDRLIWHKYSKFINQL